MKGLVPPVFPGIVARPGDTDVRHLLYLNVGKGGHEETTLVTLLAIVSLAPTLAQSDAEREVLKLNKEYEEAIARRDVSVHERLFAEDYTYTPGNGNFMSRAEHMNFTKSGAAVVKSLRSEDVRARVYGDTAVITGLRGSLDSRDGKEFAERRIRYILVYVRRGERLQIVAEQRTGAPTQGR